MSEDFTSSDAISSEHEHWYYAGFRNYVVTEALSGALPQGKNSLQRCSYGLYVEQLCGTVFTAPREHYLRTWTYRIRPSVVQSEHRQIPVGPFLYKNFAPTISPWIVILEALAPFRSQWTRPADHPQPLPYLESEQNCAAGAFDVQLEVLLDSEHMRQNKKPPARSSLSNFHYAYWTVAQMVAHHTVNGCNPHTGIYSAAAPFITLLGWQGVGDPHHSIRRGWYMVEIWLDHRRAEAPQRCSARTRPRAVGTVPCHVTCTVR